jgi:hypothetical protein
MPTTYYDLNTGIEYSCGPNGWQIPTPTGTTAGTLAAGNDPRIVGAEQTANKNAPSGYAGLDATGHVAPGQLLAAPMAGLATYFPLTEGSGVVLHDASGNGHNETLAGTGNLAVWQGAVGIALNDQSFAVANGGGMPTIGVCGYWATANGHTPNGAYYGQTQNGAGRALSLASVYGTAVGHGSDAYFPAITPSGGAVKTYLKDGISGAHCIEYVLGTNTGTLDAIVVDGQEGTYGLQGTSYGAVGGDNLNSIAYYTAGINAGDVYARPPVLYSAWTSATRDTVAQAKARTASEVARLKSLGVTFGLPPNSAATDSTCSITGTSIDQGYQASHPPSYYLAQDANIVCTIADMSVSGQAPRDMDAAYLDREGLIYHQRGLKDIAYNGGVTNGLMNYTESPTDALADEISWSRKARAQGYKTIASTMLSRTGTGYNGLTGDVLAQQYNALLLANSDEFDWIANPAAAPQLGATGANANATYFADGVHPVDAGQVFYVAAEKAAFEGVYGTPSTSVSAAYTVIPSDRLILANSTASFAVTLMDANYANFGRAGKLCVKNTGANTVTLTPVNSETIDGAANLAVASQGTACILPYVANPAAGGAVWIKVQP